MENLQIPTTNQYEVAFEQFVDTTLFERLQEKYSVKPFYLRYKTLRNVAITSSYGVNVFSIGTAFTAVFVFLNTLLANNVVAAALAVVFLGVLELFKRLTIPDFVKNILQFRKVNTVKGIAIVLLMAMSITLSYFGAKESVLLLTPQLNLSSVEDAAQHHKSRIATLEVRLGEIKKTQSWQGVLTPKGQKTYNRVTEQIAQIETDMLENTNRLNGKNDELRSKHSESTAVNASVFGILTLILDVSLLFLLGFTEYYDYRSLAEFVKQSTNRRKDSQQVQAINIDTDSSKYSDLGGSNFVATTNNGIDKRVLELAIKNAKANFQAYDAKMRNGEGNLETNERGKLRWAGELEQLEARLQVV